MIFRHPLAGIVNEIPPHLVTAGAVEIDRRTPGSAVAPGKIRSVIGQVVALRPQVVVNHVQDDRQASGMAGVHQFF